MGQYTYPGGSYCRLLLVLGKPTSSRERSKWSTSCQCGYDLYKEYRCYSEWILCLIFKFIMIGNRSLYNKTSTLLMLIASKFRENVAETNPFLDVSKLGKSILCTTHLFEFHDLVDRRFAERIQCLEYLELDALESIDFYLWNEAPCSQDKASVPEQKCDSMSHQR
jgi:hypothetical protein